MTQDIDNKMIPVTIPMEFDTEFAESPQWASMYRSIGWQVVPAMSPRDNGNKAASSWKRPFIEWRSLQNELVPDFTFTRWYGDQGEHVRRQNMGFLTGQCSANVFVLDIDLQRHAEALTWYQGIKELHNHGGDFQTPTQITGGGGLQLMFRAPEGWIPPTAKTAMGIDIRGQGGFAMLPPSLHESGDRYKWADGFEPWEVEVMEMPASVCQEIDAIVGPQNPSTQLSQSIVRTSTPDLAITPFGQIVDGRESYATRIVWAAVLDLHRECEVKPPDYYLELRMLEAFGSYELKTKSRLPIDHRSNADRLEQEGRGLTMFSQKWRAATEQWDNKVAREATLERPKKREKPAKPVFRASSIDLQYDPETGEIYNADLTVPGEDGWTDGAGVTDETSAGHVSVVPPAGPEKAKKRIELVPWADLQDEPVQWLIDGLLPAKAFAALFGKPGTYKSFVAQYISAMIGTGREVFGRPSNIGHVIYIAGEGGAGLKRRRDALIKKHGLDGETVQVHFIKTQLNLRSTDADLIALIKEIKALGIKPDLIVIDTLARAFAGGNENAPEDMGAFISIIGALQDALDTAVLIVHHSGKDEARGLRGHSSLLGAVDTELEVTKISPDGSKDRIGKLSVTKQKDGEDGYEINYRMELVSFSQIDPQNSSLVVVPMDGEVVSERKKRPLNPNDQVVLKALKAALDDAPERVSSPRIPANKLVTKVSTWRSSYYMLSANDQESKKKTFSRASERLVSRGTVCVLGEYCWISDD